MGLNVKQSEAMQKVVAGNNLFISGPGGVGKSHLVRHIIDKFHDSTVLLAPTGIAALNIGGATIHSAFKFPLGILTKREHSNVKEKVRDLFGPEGPVKRIIIDEIPMVRADVFKAIDVQLRKARRKNVPFGGIQVIVVGDFYQLPPVVVNREKKYFFQEYRSQFAFGESTWAEGNFEYIELDEIMRQSDAEFIGHLQSVRRKTDDYREAVNFFNDHGHHNVTSVLEHDPVFLCTTNATADSINEDNYDSLEGEERVFRGQVSGTFPAARPAPQELRLKYGTKVIFTANSRNGDFKNGETGYVVGYLGDKIKVLKETNEQEVMVDVNTWEEREYINEGGNLGSFVVGKYVQYPLKHGWAITIHKSQGMTIDHAIIDMNRGAFASGQTYVALSRLRTMEGMGIMGTLSYSDVIVDPEIQEFYANDCRGIGLGL